MDLCAACAAFQLVIELSSKNQNDDPNIFYQALFGAGIAYHRRRRFMVAANYFRRCRALIALDGALHSGAYRGSFLPTDIPSRAAAAATNLSMTLLGEIHCRIAKFDGECSSTSSKIGNSQDISGGLKASAGITPAEASLPSGIGDVDTIAMNSWRQKQ